MDSSDDDTIDYTSWTPEQLMRDYHGELKYELLVRCMEWYTNSEVEARINAGRTDGSKIQNSNFYAEFKRNLEIVALRDGHLPTEYRLQFDKRRFINFEARFGSNDRAVKMLRNSVRRRDAVAVPKLRANPSLKELEAVRSDNGKNLQKGRETRDYWFKFLAATKTHSLDQIRTTYNMAPSTVTQELQRAKRIVARLREIERIESNGGSIPQTYTPPPLIEPGQTVDNYVGPALRPRRVVVLPVSFSTGAALGANDSTKPSSSPGTTPTSPLTPTSLLSTRMRSTLSRLRHHLTAHPHQPLSFPRLASRFEPPIECLDMTDLERHALATCETKSTLAAFRAWSETVGAEILEENEPARVSSCLAHVIHFWRDEVLDAEEEGVEELGDTFLEVVMRRLGDLGDVEAEVEGREREEEEWAREVEMEM